MNKLNTDNHRLPSAALILLMLLPFAATPAGAAGLLTPKGHTQSLSIRDHDVRVIVEDGYVVTQVEQVFANAESVDQEAVYSFPVPEHAAVAEFTFWIDGKPVTGEVLEKQKAREVYESEKQAGRETAVAEKDGYRDFEISVYPVRAAQDVRIRLVYLQSAHTDTGVGRYVYPLAEGGVDEQRDAFWSMNDVVTNRFSFAMDLKSSYPIDAIRLPGQTSGSPQQLGPGHWKINFDSNAGEADFDAQVDAIESGVAEVAPVAAAPVRLDKDIVVYWRHQPGLPGSVDMVAYKPDASGRGTFMLTLTPGDDLPLIESGRDWVFVLDTSGSMQGKFATLAHGVEQALGKLNPADRFRIIAFNDRAHELTRGDIQADVQNVQHYISVVSQLNAGGGTNLHAGIERALRGLDESRPTAIVLVTDGVANVGVTEKRAFLKLLENYDVRLFTFIMGNSANRPLLEAMTEVSNGFAMSVSTSDDIAGRLVLSTEKVTHHAMHDINVRLKGVKVADVTPPQPGSLYRGEQLIVFGHYWGSGPVQLALTGRVAGQPVSYNTQFDMPEVQNDNPEVERLWAYAAIEDLQSVIDYYGEDDDSESAIVDLAVEYGLVTDYTSMIVVREEVFQSYGIDRLNRDRVAIERDARKRRLAQAPQSRRVDTQQPMYRKTRPSVGGGGGSSDPITLLLMALATALTIARRSRNQVH